MGLANTITLGRGVLTLVLWGVLVAGGTSPAGPSWTVAIVLFAVAALTDALDGMVARSRGETSAFGRMADPLVDKLLVIGTMVVLLGIPRLQGVLPAWIVAVILGRELVVTAVRAVIEARQVAFGAAPSGKAKMVLQCAAVLGTLAYGADMAIARAEVPGLALLPGGGATWNVAHALVWGALVLTVASGVAYVRRALGLLRVA
jgi:CDP-diacylglycerol--glycerol-3-phosphate 3-phosphatidyltransferase